MFFLNHKIVNIFYFICLKVCVKNNYLILINYNITVFFINNLFLGDSCCNPFSLGKIIKVLQKNLGTDSYVKSLEIGGTFEQVLYKFTFTA